MAEMVFGGTTATGIMGSMVINMIVRESINRRRWNLIWVPMALGISTNLEGIKVSLIMITVFATVGLCLPNLEQFEHIRHHVILEILTEW